MAIQVYGQLNDWGSFSNVTRALCRELRVKNLNATVYGVGTLNTRYLSPYIPVGFNNAANVGLYVGYPEESVGWLKGHKHRVLMTVCETDRIPNTWVDAANDASLVVVPSQWCYDAFKSSGVKREIIIIPHGVWYDSSFEKSRFGGQRSIRLLHVSGALSFASRKGTSQTLLGFKRFINNAKMADTWLDLKIPKTKGLEEVITQLDLWDNVHILPNETLSPRFMRELLTQYDAVIQPSRAEGFGLVPLEARCLGVPSIITFDTGHLQHYAPECDVEVETGRLETLPTKGNPIGSAPRLTVDAVYKSLIDFSENSDEYRRKTLAWAEKEARLWSWTNVLKPLIRKLRELSGKNHRIRLGASSSLIGA